MSVLSWFRGAVTTTLPGGHAEASARRREGHRSGGAARAAREGQTWDAKQRARERSGR